jgi:hypothetical protein
MRKTLPLMYKGFLEVSCLGFDERSKRSYLTFVLNSWDMTFFMILLVLVLALLEFDFLDH